MPEDIPFSHVIEVAAIAPEGERVELIPDEATRARLAAVADVVAIPALKVQFEVRPADAGGAVVIGKLEGVVRQVCVVSLDEFDNPVSEEFAVDFAAEPERTETDDDEEGEDLPDPIIDGKIDLGALATEFLILAVDPYPRKPGVEFAGLSSEEAAAEPKRSPFDQLSGLKDRIKKQ
ncbi:MAG: DUF177 domain-containing protein [Xanthobacteraceae bacterium]|nr:DUF177 domain-containing protein [Xanthobacteraceae bacterium]